ncbi:hypothetical protein VIGAN_01316000, partial [Vigna angularis var. angularis]
ICIKHNIYHQSNKRSSSPYLLKTSLNLSPKGLISFQLQKFSTSPLSQNLQPLFHSSRCSTKASLHFSSSPPHLLSVLQE